MTREITGPLGGPCAVPWCQTRTSGRSAAPAEALRPGAIWDWAGPAEPLDAAQRLQLLARRVEDDALRQRAARRARRLTGLDPRPRPAPGPLGFVLAQGATRFAGLLSAGPGGPRAVFAEGLPPRDTPLVVVEVTGPDLPLRLDRPSFLPGGLALGTGIATPAGLVPVERLAPGDAVLARDGGTRRVACALHWQAEGGPMRLAPRLVPVTVRAGALGAGHPFADVTLAPGQEVAIAGADVLALFGRARVLLPVARLAGLPGIAAAATAGPRRFVRLTLDRPDLVLAEGLACASAVPGAAAAPTPETLALPGRGAPGPAAAPPDLRPGPAEAAQLVAALAARAAAAPTAGPTAGPTAAPGNSH